MKFNINCDLGEGMTNDTELMPYIHECNIACGGHFGDTHTISSTLKLAIKHNVLVGAHPSFPDKKNFGRKIISLSADDLSESLYNQIANFNSLCSQFNVKMNHIKLHGALYNLTCLDSRLAQLVLDVYLQLNISVKLFAPYKSVLAQLAKGKFEVIYEAFIDRRYNQDLSLVSRSLKRAVIKNPENACNQVSSIINKGLVTSIDGNKVAIKADTFCLHSDNPQAIQLAQYLYRKCQ